MQGPSCRLCGWRQWYQGFGQVLHVSSIPGVSQLEPGAKSFSPAGHVCHPEASACKKLTLSSSFTLRLHANYLPLVHMAGIPAGG